MSGVSYLIAVYLRKNNEVGVMLPTVLRTLLLL